MQISWRLKLSPIMNVSIPKSLDMQISVIADFAISPFECRIFHFHIPTLFRPPKHPKRSHTKTPSTIFPSSQIAPIANKAHSKATAKIQVVSNANWNWNNRNPSPELNQTIFISISITISISLPFPFPFPLSDFQWLTHVNTPMQKCNSNSNSNVQCATCNSQQQFAQRAVKIKSLKLRH